MDALVLPYYLTDIQVDYPCETLAGQVTERVEKLSDQIPFILPLWKKIDEKFCSSAHLANVSMVFDYSRL